MVTSIADVDREVRELIVKHMREGTPMHEATLREELLALHPIVTDVSYNVLARANLARSRVVSVLADYRRERKGLGFDS